MSYVTIDQLAAHALKSRSAVLRALRAQKVTLEKFPGAKGARLTVSAANRFIARQWPTVAPIDTERKELA